MPAGWVRDGTHASMAHLGRFAHSTVAFCVADDDPLAHAEWRFERSAYIGVRPGEELVVEWEEMYSIGLANKVATTYSCPPPGKYRLRVNVVSAMGIPGKEQDFEITIFRPYWMRFWFWGVVALGLSFPVAFGVRAMVAARMRHHVSRMEQEHMVKRERLRIARDIHDDLGARLTHISLVSGRAGNAGLSEAEASQNFRKISAMTRDLVVALYETVWSVDPQNDHLDALISYLTQMVENLCEPASIRCRIKVPDECPNHTISSAVRHNISLAVKEAVHNAVKYSGASEISIRFAVSAGSFAISLADDGCGFDIDHIEHGNGLKNLRSRMEAIGGVAKIESAAGRGTSVTLDIPLS
jgi:signal transduction histidine kinase